MFFFTCLHIRNKAFHTTVRWEHTIMDSMEGLGWDDTQRILSLLEMRVPQPQPSAPHIPVPLLLEVGEAALGPTSVYNHLNAPQSEIKSFFQDKSVLPMMAIGTECPCLYLNPRAFPSSFLPLHSWEGEGEHSWVRVWQPAKANPSLSIQTSYSQLLLNIAIQKIILLKKHVSEREKFFFFLLLVICEYTAKMNRGW